MLWNKKQLKKHALLALKIGVGSSLAILIAGRLHLDNMVSAGTITLLTLMTSKWETVRLSIFRVITFGVSIAIAWLVFLHIEAPIPAYGCYIFLTVLIAELFNLRATISVNAVIGAHLLITHDFSLRSIENEFILVLIGIVIALILNQIQNNREHKKDMIGCMRRTEKDMQDILRKMSDYLLDAGDQVKVWDDINGLDQRLLTYIRDAGEYQDNTFHSHPVYYIDYFEMRYDQCQVLDSLHSSLQQIRSMPAQAKVVAEYIIYLTDYVIEINHPEQQELELKKVFDSMSLEELPESREEFESRALLYHILKDLESFLAIKRRFVEKLDEKQLDRYWNSFLEG